MAATNHILIGGGTGFVGRHLVRCFRNAGAQVKVITRKIDQGADYLTWNQIRDDGLPKDTTAVINVAGRNILDPTIWTESYKRDVYDSRIETNRTLVDAIQKSETRNLKAFVTISGVGYYRPSDSVEYDETWRQEDERSSGDSDQRPDYLMKLARDWEESSKLPEEQSTESIRRIVIRSGVVLGAGGGIIKQLKFPFSMGLGGPLGTGQQWFPWIHVDDLVNIFKQFTLNESNANYSGIINGVAPEQVRNIDFVRAFGKALNRPAFIPLPSFVVDKLFGSDRAAILLRGQRVKSKAESLGFTYKHPKIFDACKASLT